MTSIFHTARTLAVGSLLAARLFLTPGAVSAQGPAPAPLPAAADKDPKEAPGKPLPPMEPSGKLLPPIGADSQPSPAAQAPCATCGQASSGFDWSKVPQPQVIPRPGWFLLPPDGEGYYTALDMFRGEKKDKWTPSPYTPIFCNTFWDADFRYLDKPDGQPVDFFDRLKRMHFGDDWMLSIGGEFRDRYVNEIGGANGRLNGKDQRYDLMRNRVYGDLWYQDRFRVYVEFLDAQSFGQSLPPLAIDIDRSDLLNAFVDIKLGEFGDNPLYARIGRQEMFFGSQRLISPLEWSNTRRTFEGARAFWHSECFDVDAFWVRPVQNYPNRFDAADANRQFAGAWATYRPSKEQTIDLFWLYLDEDLPVGLGKTTGGRFGYDVHTVGGRYNGYAKMSDLSSRAEGLCGSLLWDIEGAYQFGDYSNRLIAAGMTSTGVGYSFAGLPMEPQLWAYYDYASGTPNPDGTGTWSTFNQMFPFGHYYFGYLDEIGRENIHDLNFQASLYPAKWITFLSQYHFFRLDQAKDALYGTSPGYPVVRRDPTGRAGTDVGQELDLFLNFTLDRHSTLQIGYSKLFAGDFIKQTGVNTSPELFYVQYYFRW
jgi:Alginate export